MHLPPLPVATDSENETEIASKFEPPTVKFLSLELTNRCNLRCIHCYTESSPDSGDKDVMTAEDYESVMYQAYALGCRVIQFIGGEAQLNRDFLRLLKRAQEIGFEYIEVFTNLTRLTEDVLAFASAHDVKFATSVYSDDPEVHDSITRVPSSHARTVSNLKRLSGRGVESRAAVIKFEQTQGAI